MVWEVTVEAPNRSQPGKLDLSEYDAFVFKVRGDGRTYYANVRISFKDFRATSFGRIVPDARPFDTSNVESVGFLLGDKKAGPFKLEVAWIKGILKQSK